TGDARLERATLPGIEAKLGNRERVAAHPASVRKPPVHAKWIEAGDRNGAIGKQREGLLGGWPLRRERGTRNDPALGVGLLRAPTRRQPELGDGIGPSRRAIDEH